MNRIYTLKGSLAFALLYLFTFFPTPATPLFLFSADGLSAQESWRKYDINSDGQFDQADINEIIDRGAQNIDFDLNNDGKKDMDDALALFLKLSVMDRSCNGVVDNSDYEPVDPVTMPEVPDIKTVRKIVSESVSLARTKLPYDIEDQAFKPVPDGIVLTLEERASVYQVAGLSGLAQRNLDAAIWGFGRSFQTDESSASAIGSLAFCMSASDNDEEALLLLAYARDLFPESAPTATSLGMVFARHGQNEEALEYLNEAVLYTPEIAQYHMNLGILLMRMGKDHEAFVEFREATERDPSDAAKYIFFYTTKPPGEPPPKKPFDPEEFKKDREAEITEMEELGYSKEELPVSWDQMSPCEQAVTIPEMLERKYDVRMEEIAREYANEAASQIEKVIKKFWPEWKNYIADWNRYVDGIPVVYKADQVIMKNAEKMAGDERAALTRQMGAELLGYSSFFMESALKQATADANEGIKRLRTGMLTDQVVARLKEDIYADALENAMDRCYKQPVGQAYQWIRVGSSSYGLPNPDIEALKAEDFMLLYMVIPLKCFDIEGYCPDDEGDGAKKPDLPFDTTIGIDLFIISIEWNPATDEFELNLGEGVMVGMTWNPETGFGAQVGLGFHGSVGAAGGEMAVYAKFDEGILTVEGELEGSVGVGPFSVSSGVSSTQVVGEMYNPRILD